MVTKKDRALRPPFLLMLASVGGAGGLEFMTGRAVPPGNVWLLSDTLAVAAIVAGAGIAGWLGLRWYESLLLGSIAATFFDVWLPDSRDYIAMRLGGPPFDWYLRNYLIFVLATGIVCAGTTEAARVTRRLITRDRLGKCSKCGYDLRGLPDPRCPECGVPFDPVAVPSMDGEKLVSNPGEANAG